MLRFIFVILVCLPDILYYVPKMRRWSTNPAKYNLKKCYILTKIMISTIKTKGFVFTKAYGKENLPKNTGYVMFPNHQGKYDVLGIMATHKEPCSFVMDHERAKLPIVKDFVKFIRAITLDKSSIKQQRIAIKKVSAEVEKGGKYIIFPEGGYANNGNKLQNFYSGCFRSAVDAKCPIVPVALINSYKVFTGLSLAPVFTRVYYLEPIYYEEYKNMKTSEISEMVKKRINNVIESKTSWHLRRSRCWKHI